MKHILDPSFRYTSSVATDLKKTFARVRRRERIAAATSAPSAPLRVVVPIARRSKP